MATDAVARSALALALAATALAVATAPFPVRAADPAVVETLVQRVDAQRIEAHTIALEYARYLPADQQDAATYIVAELTSYGYVPTFDPIAESENVLVRIVGARHPDRVFVLGAHFDTVAGSPGADDNASGVAALLEIARALADQQPDVTIELAFYTLEEVGKIGSRQHASSLLAEQQTVAGMVAFDMIGYTCAGIDCQTPTFSIPGCMTVTPQGLTTGQHIAVGSNTASAWLLSRLVAASNTFVAGLDLQTVEVAGTGLCFPDTRRSDHASFWDEGVPAILVSDGAGVRNPNYHEPTDRVFTLDFEFAGRVTRAALALAVQETFPEADVDLVAVDLQVDPQQMTWAAAPNAISYDLVRGNLTRLRLSGGSFDSAIELCLANDTPFPAWSGVEIVPPGQGKFYLVRPNTAAGPGSWSSGAPSEIEPRDDEIDASFNSCP